MSRSSSGSGTALRGGFGGTSPAICVCFTAQPLPRGATVSKAQSRGAQGLDFSCVHTLFMVHDL